VLDILIRVSQQEEPDGPYVLGRYNLVAVEGHGIEISPKERLPMHLEALQSGTTAKVVVEVIRAAVAANPTVGLFTTLEGEAAIAFAQRRWKLEYWAGCGIGDGKPTRDNEGKIAGPDGVLYFIGQPPADGSFDWPAFHAVVETWREASDSRDLAEMTLVAAVREALEQNTASVAELARHIGWSAEYTRLVGRGERLPTPTAPVKTYDKIELAEMAVTRIHGGPEANPNELITQAMTLLAQAREILANHS
jgi:hypothetical protein